MGRSSRAATISKPLLVCLHVYKTFVYERLTIASRAVGETGVTTRFCYALDLKDDAALIAAYEARHRPHAVWPGVLEDIRQRGVVEMEIWRADNRLLMICEVTGPEETPTPVSSETAAWEAEMDVYQQHLPGRPREKWVLMTRVFCLTECSE